MTHLGTVYFVLEVFQVAQVLDHTSPCFRERKCSVHARPVPGSPGTPHLGRASQPLTPRTAPSPPQSSRLFSLSPREPVLYPQFALRYINSVTSARSLAGKEYPCAPSGYLFARILSQRAFSARESESPTIIRYGALSEWRGSMKQTSAQGILSALCLSLWGLGSV